MKKQTGTGESPVNWKMDSTEGAVWQVMQSSSFWRWEASW